MHKAISILALFNFIPLLAAEPLPRGEPEAEGVSSQKLQEFIETLDREGDGVHSVMVLRHGKIITEGWWAPYSAESNHVLYSLSKSFTSTAIGFAVAEGKVDIFDPVLKFFPDEAPDSPSENLRAMRVRDLLTMSTGHQDEPPISSDKISAATFLAHPAPHKPGTHFRYNTAATFMQSAIVQKVSGQSVLDYLKPRLFEPLGISKPRWETSFEGISLGGYGLRVRTEDIAKLGQLYLQKGKWNGAQLLPESWIEQASLRQMSNGSNPDGDWDQGYGFQFWRCRHNAYRGDGAFGQYCIVMPDQEMVVAITSGVKDMPKVLQIVWDKLLPAVSEKELPKDIEAVAALRKKLENLSLATAIGKDASPRSKAVFKRTFTFTANDQKVESLKLLPDKEGQSILLVMQTGGVESRLRCGYGKWLHGRAPFSAGRLAEFKEEAVAGCFAWENDDVLVIKKFATETPFGETLKLTFKGNGVTLDREMNVGFGATKWEPLTGKSVKPLPLVPAAR